MSASLGDESLALSLQLSAQRCSRICNPHIHTNHRPTPTISGHGHQHGGFKQAVGTELLPPPQTLNPKHYDGKKSIDDNDDNDDSYGEDSPSHAAGLGDTPRRDFPNKV